MMAQGSNIEAAPTEILSQEVRTTCARCVVGLLQSSRISTAFWRGDGLVVLRNIPAMVCRDCGEQYVDDQTVVQLDHLRGRDFSGLTTISQVFVPILDFGTAG